MAYCGPVCAVPSCEATPTVGLGGCGAYGGSLGCGSGGATTSAASLGVLQGVCPSCINQLPPTECVIDRPAVVAVFPGPILTSSCDPVLVGGYSPCSPAGVCELVSGRYCGRRSGSLGGGGLVCNPCF